VELSWCRSFIAVHEQGGFAAAARALHRSQSRVSAHVADLEAEVGDVLFYRDVHPPALTAAGAAFLPHARAAVAEWQAAIGAVAAEKGEVRGEVAIGGIPSVSAVLLAPLLASFGVQHPDVRFTVHEGPNSWLDEALAHRTIELALRAMSDERSRGIGRKVLFTDPFRVVLRRDHRAAEKQIVDIDDLAGLPVITTGEAGLDAHIGGEFRETLAAANIEVSRSLAVTQPTTVYAFVRAGIGIGVLGELATRIVHDPEVVVRPLRAKRAWRRVGLHWAETRRMSPAATEFAAALDDLVRGEIESGALLAPDVLDD
jgi:DNA-binding transcriptional LysR family regulator